MSYAEPWWARWYDLTNQPVPMHLRKTKKINNGVNSSSIRKDARKIQSRRFKKCHMN